MEASEGSTTPRVNDTSQPPFSSCLAALVYSLALTLLTKLSFSTPSLSPPNKLNYRVRRGGRKDHIRNFVVAFCCCFLCCCCCVSLCCNFLLFFLSFFICTYTTAKQIFKCACQAETVWSGQRIPGVVLCAAKLLKSYMHKKKKKLINTQFSSSVQQKNQTSCMTRTT